MQLRVQLGFTNAPDHSLEETAGAVIDGLYGNAYYPTPPLSSLELGTALTAFTAAIAAQVQGGPAATAEKNNKREILVGMLRVCAGYVQENHDNDMAKLLSSGFEAVSTNRAQHPLEKPEIRDIKNGIEGQLSVRIGAVRNARNYETRYALLDAAGAPGPWQSAGLASDSRALPVNGLTPGAKYNIAVRAVGGSTGYSDWSDTVSHRSM